MNLTPLWFPSTKGDEEPYKRVHHLRFVKWDFAKGFVDYPGPFGCHKPVVMDGGWAFEPPADVVKCPVCAQITRDSIPGMYPPPLYS